MMTLPVKWAGLLGLAVLVGCNQGPDGPSLQLELFQLASAKAGSIGKKEVEAETPPLTRAALDTLTEPYLEVTLEKRDIVAYLSQQQQRRDDTPGLIEVWRTTDDITLTLRSGVLVASRGMGDDILSASALVAAGPGPISGGERRYQIRGLDNQAQSLTMACTLQDLGPETVEIVELRHATRHLQERCEGGGGLVVNDYWVDSRSGRVWQSRQWAGPTIGYLRIRQITI